MTRRRRLAVIGASALVLIVVGIAESQLPAAGAGACCIQGDGA